MALDPDKFGAGQFADAVREANDELAVEATVSLALRCAQHPEQRMQEPAEAEGKKLELACIAPGCQTRVRVEFL